MTNADCQFQSYSPLPGKCLCATHLIVTTQINESWHTYEWSRSTHMDEWPTQILNSSHSLFFGKEASVTHLFATTQRNDSWHTYEWSHSTHICEWPTQILNSSHSRLFGKEACVTHLMCDYTTKWVITHVWAKTWQNLNRKRLDRSLRQNYRSLLQNIVSFIGLFCKRDLWYLNRKRD